MSFERCPGAPPRRTGMSPMRGPAHPPQGGWYQQYPTPPGGQHGYLSGPSPGGSHSAYPYAQGPPPGPFHPDIYYGYPGSGGGQRPPGASGYPYMPYYGYPAPPPQYSQPRSYSSCPARPSSSSAGGSGQSSREECSSKTQKRPSSRKTYDRNKDMQMSMERTRALEEEFRDFFKPTNCLTFEDSARHYIHEGTACYGAAQSRELYDEFEEELVRRTERAREGKPKYEMPVFKPRPCKHHHQENETCSLSEGSGSDSDSSCSSNSSHSHSKCKSRKRKRRCSSSSSSSSDSSTSSDEDEINWNQEIERKKQHPERLHTELWFNEPGQILDGPLCRCSVKSRTFGIRHQIYPGEQPIAPCNLDSNNAHRLHHYRVAITPTRNFVDRNPTVIHVNGLDYRFEGFSLLSHKKLQNVPDCKCVRFNIEYKISLHEEALPHNFTIRELNLFQEYVFVQLLELYDVNWNGTNLKEPCCQRYHPMPRFVRPTSENGKEMLSMYEVLRFLLKKSGFVTDEETLKRLPLMDDEEWANFVDSLRGYIVTVPSKRPCCIRVDQVDREPLEAGDEPYPVLIHFGFKPAQLCFAGDPEYQKTWKAYLKLKHLIQNKPKVSSKDKSQLVTILDKLQAIRNKSSMRRELTVEISCKEFNHTGIRSDICQHALLVPTVVDHLRFHDCLYVLENHIGYVFKDKFLLQLALTHPSYITNFGTNPDHARNSSSNCGLRLPEYGDRRDIYKNIRKRGITVLINTMAKMGERQETSSKIKHNERLEFFGDAIIEFLTSIHLFMLLPEAEEGVLSTYRSALVQNQYLAILAKKLRLEEFMLYAHGPDLCGASDLRHAMANCFEAVMAAIYLDSDLNTVDGIYGTVLFEGDHLETWKSLPRHPLQIQEPQGDRQYIEKIPVLKKLHEFESTTGLEFRHIRLLARAFTMRNVGFNHLTLGHNQRLEFLGDSVLQFVTSDYVYRHFPEHHEGHLSILRSCLVSNKTQSIVFGDLNMEEYVIHNDSQFGKNEKLDLKQKERADVVEAFMGALYVDQGMSMVRKFCDVCFFPRLKEFIMTQEWNDPKSQLQQCCLTLRDLSSGEPDVPQYKVIEVSGPTNSRMYRVAVYFRDKRLAVGRGRNIQETEMDAAQNALANCEEMFPQLKRQKQVVINRYKDFYDKEGTKRTKF